MFSTSRLLPWYIFPRPNPPQLPNPRWRPKTKMHTSALKIHLHCRLPLNEAETKGLVVTGKRLSTCDKNNPYTVL